MKLLGIEVSLEEFDYLMCEQSKGKELKVENDKIIATFKIKSEKEIEIEEYKLELKNSLSYLKETDYIANKLSEAISEYIETGDNTEVILLRTTYKEQLEKRAEYRKRVDELKILLKDY